MTKTAPYQPTIGIIFDFDGTLAPDSTGSLVKSLGVAPGTFWRDHVHRRIDEGWDPSTAQMYSLLEVGRSPETGEQRLTRALLEECGRNLKPFEGVEELFDRLRERAHQKNSDITLEFYIISCGLTEIICRTSIARHFKDIWASSLHFDDAGRAEFPKVILSHTEKLRYLYGIVRGVEKIGSVNQPFATQGQFEDDELRIPLDQIIYIGDGLTDMPCFSVVYRNNGIALGIYKEQSKEKWGRAAGESNDGWVSNLAVTDYSENSELVESLALAVDSIASRITLRAKTRGDLEAIGASRPKREP